MNKYYTSINSENNQFVGIVYNSENNQQVYKTQPHNSQLKAVQEINSFLQNKTGISPTLPSRPIEITNTIQPVMVSGGTRKCCGR
jgi:hypothetical protein